MLVKKSLLWTLVKYGIGLALLGWVVCANWKSANGSPGLEMVFERNLDYGPLILAGLVCLAGLLLTFYRWYLLVRAQELPFAVSDAMRLGLIGYAMSNFLPTSVGGDIIKAAFVAREQSRRAIAVATVIFDRVLGLCGLFWLVAVVGVFFWAAGQLESPGLAAIVYGAWGLTGASILFWFALHLVPRHWVEPFAERLARVPKVGHSLAELWRAAWIYHNQTKAVSVAVALAFLGHIGFVLSFYFAACAIIPLDEVPSLQTHFLIVPVGMIIQAGFFTPGGVGGGEVAFGWLYGLVGSTFAAGVLGMLMLRVISWVLGGAGYFIYLRMRPSLIGNVRTVPREVSPAKYELAPVEV
jgi:uncharacterized membrane protein YbhN (UPF0104 family)